MFGLDGSELVVIAVVALVVIGPKDLPRVMRMVGQWVGKARAMSRHVRSGFDAMMREAELEEMQKQWDAQNAAIIAATQVSDPMQLAWDTPEASAAALEAPVLMPADMQAAVTQTNAQASDVQTSDAQLSDAQISDAQISDDRADAQANAPAVTDRAA